MKRCYLLLVVLTLAGASSFAQEEDFKVALAVRGSAPMELSQELGTLLETKLLESGVSFESIEYVADATLDDLRDLAQAANLDVLVIISADRDTNLTVEIAIRTLPSWEEAYSGVSTAPATRGIGRGTSLLMQRAATTVAMIGEALLIARDREEPQPEDTSPTVDEALQDDVRSAASNKVNDDLADDVMSSVTPAEPGPTAEEDATPADDTTADTVADGSEESRPIPDQMAQAPVTTDPSNAAPVDDSTVAVSETDVSGTPEAEQPQTDQPQDPVLSLPPTEPTREPTVDAKRSYVWSVSLAGSQSLGVTLTDETGVWWGSLTGISAVARLRLITIGTVHLSVEPQAGYRFEVTVPDQTLAGEGSRIISHTAAAVILGEATIGNRFGIAVGAQFTHPFAGTFVGEYGEVPFGSEPPGVTPYVVARASYRAPWLSRLYIGAQMRFAIGVGVTGVVPLEFGAEFVVGRYSTR